MTRVKDTLYRKIEEGLKGPLEPAMFEKCAVALLRSVYPGLVPTGGPQDGGMDGAVSTPDGPPMLLVCTTSPDVIGNFTKSLTSYMERDGDSRAVVVATSQFLSSAKRRNLKKRAEKYELELRNVHDGNDFVIRLYQNPFWRKELLDIPGDPPALSVYPRPWVPEAKTLHGRDDELDWLRNQEQDFVLFGPPGVGKTNLLQELAEEGLGLFVATSDDGQIVDEGRIVDAWRETKPKFLLLPNVHLKPALLQTLLSLRLELDMDFRIAGTAWRSLRDEPLPEWWPAPTQRAIGGLSRAATAQVVRSVGIQNEALIAEILDQCGCEPGLDPIHQSQYKASLAIILALHAAKGNAVGLLDGNFLLRHIKTSCKLTNPDLDILAVAAIGGRDGMTLANMSKALKQDEARIRIVLDRAILTGILSDSRYRDGPVSVMPEALRNALIASTFFGGATSLPVEPALALAENATSATEALISALGRGLPVPHDVVQRRLPRDPYYQAHCDLWINYAWAGGKRAVSWLLSKAAPAVASDAKERPRSLAAIAARPALHFLPHRAVEALISELPDDTVHDALRDWMTALDANVVPRRQRVLGEANRRSCKYGDSAVLALIPTVFRLGLQDTRWGRIARGTFTLRYGLLSSDDVEALFESWPEVLGILKGKEGGVEIAQRVAQHWCKPKGMPGAIPTEDWLRVVRKCAEQMLSDVVALADERPGIALWAHRTAAHGRLVVKLPQVDSEIDDLFPLFLHPRQTPEVQGTVAASPSPHRRRRMAQEKKATELTRIGANAGTDELLRLNEEGTLARRSPEQQLQGLVEIVAQATEEPSAWAVALAKRDAPCAWVASFVDVALARSPQVEEMWNSLLANTKYDHVVVWAGIRHGDVPERVERRIAIQLLAIGGRLPWGISWKDVSEAWKLQLLQCEHEKVAMTVAEGMWWADDLTAVSNQLLSAWVDVVAKSDDEQLLREVFCGPSPVARRAVCAWFLVPRPDDPKIDDWDDWDDWDDLEDMDRVREYAEQAMNLPRVRDDLLEMAASALDRETKTKLIRSMPAETTQRAFLAIVGQDPELYSVLLGRHDLSHIHLSPFHNGGARIDFALRALDAGYRPSEIARQIEPDQSPIVFTASRPDGAKQRIDGIFEDRWNALRRTMEAWAGDVNPGVRNIAEQVLEREF